MGPNEIKYAAGNRLLNTKTTSLLCVGEDTTSSYIGMLSMDEVALAGGSTSSNTNYYLHDNASSNVYIYSSEPIWSDSGEIYNWTSTGYLTMSASSILVDYIKVARVDFVTGEIKEHSQITYGFDTSIRPVITLAINTPYTDGTGLIGDPYIVR